jgi:hypothetical protein
MGRINRALIARDAYCGARSSGHRVRFESESANHIADIFHLFGCGFGFHYDKHDGSLSFLT